jgi:hypothetical protein
MNHSKLTKILELPLSIAGLLLNTEPSKATDWSESNTAVSCQSNQQNMSDAAVGTSHSKPFTYSSNATPPHSACYATPDGYEITLYKIGMCTDDPFHSTDADINFSDTNCTWTMESDSGVTVDLAASLNQSLALPSASTRPPNGTYTYFAMVMANNIKIKGSYTTTDETNGGTFYTKPSDNPGSTNSPGLFDKSLSAAQFFTNEFDEYGFNVNSPCRFDYQRTVSTGDNQGVVRAVVTNSSLETATNCSSIARVVGVFKSNNSLTINEETNGLEIKFVVSGSGLYVEGGGPGDSTYQPNWAYSGDFIPTFNTF